MATEMKRLMVSITPELEPELDQLKKERFYNTTQAEMFRYLIALGLESVKSNQLHANQGQKPA